MVEDDSPDTTDTAKTSTPANPGTTTTAAPAERDPQRREILLALIQHGSKPLVMLLIFLVVAVAAYRARCHIQVWMANAELVKFGSLEVRLREAAQSGEIGQQIRSLADLTDEQLELFLIIGAERKSSIHYLGPEVTLPNLTKLQDLGLLQNVVPAANNKPFSWEVSETGSKLHSTILKLVADSISNAVRVPLPDCPKCGDAAPKTKP